MLQLHGHKICSPLYCTTELVWDYLQSSVAVNLKLHGWISRSAIKKIQILSRYIYKTRCIGSEFMYLGGSYIVNSLITTYNKNKYMY